MKYILLFLMVTFSYSQVWVRGSNGMIKLAGQTLSGDSVTVTASASVDSSIYASKSWTTNQFMAKGSSASVDSSIYASKSWSNNQLQGKLSNIADTAKYLEKYNRNSGDTTLLRFYGGSDTVRVFLDSSGYFRTPIMGVKSYQEDVDEFVSTTVTSKFNWTATNSTGSHAATPSDTTGIGQQRGTTGASATGSSYQSTYVQAFTGGNGTLTFEARVRLNQTITNGTGNAFKYCVGFGDVVTGAISTDGVWFQTDSIASGKWVCYSKSGANIDSASVGSVITANTWYVLRAEIDGYKGSTLPSVRFYINGTLVRTIFSATKVPVGSALFGMMTGITKFTGSNTTAKTYDIDYFYYSKRYGYNNPPVNR